MWSKNNKTSDKLEYCLLGKKSQNKADKSPLDHWKHKGNVWKTYKKKYGEYKSKLMLLKSGVKWKRGENSKKKTIPDGSLV